MSAVVIPFRRSLPEPALLCIEVAEQPPFPRRYWTISVKRRDGRCDPRFGTQTAVSAVDAAGYAADLSRRLGLPISNGGAG
jgi:hypothetical protein